MNYWLLLIAAAGTLVLYIVEWNKLGKLPSNWQKYALALAVGAIVAYTINNDFTQALATFGAVLMSKWLYDGWLRLGVSGNDQMQKMYGISGKVDKDGRPYWTTGRKWFAAFGVVAFISAISFFHKNSYVADKYEINGLFIGIGVVFCLASIFCLWQVSKHSYKGGGN